MMNIRKVLLLATAMLCSSALFANISFHIEDNGYYFRIMGGNEVELVKCSAPKLDEFIGDDGNRVTLPSRIQYDHKQYSLASIGDSVFYNMPSLTIVVPPTIRNIGRGNDVKRIVLSSKGKYVDSYGSMVVDRIENRIVWISADSKEYSVVKLPKGMHRLPDDFIAHFPKMKTLISPSIDTLSYCNTVVGYRDTIYVIDTKAWQWHSPNCAKVERLMADVSWNDAQIQAIEQYFPNLKSIYVRADKKGAVPSPYVSICGALCYKNGKGIVHIPARMRAETDTLTIFEQSVEHIPADFFAQFPQLKHINIEKHKSNKALKVKQNKLLYKSKLVAEVSCAIKVNAYDIIEKQPEFPGGVAEMLRYLQRNIRYPAICQEQGIQGRVVVQFVVNADGSIVDAKVVKPVNPHLDKEAVRVVKAMPKWQPGVRKDEPVRVRFTIPVTFRLSK